MKPKRIIDSVRDMQTIAEDWRSAGRRLVLVPTMGALHEGHINLVREAIRHGDEIIVSIFVNPTQFGPGEDFGRYPRTLEEDLRRLADVAPEAVVFCPMVSEIYPNGPAGNRTWVLVEDLDRHLCGAHREGHFRGVTTVVAQLFIICRPHVAVFGLKDAQQFVILKRMVADLHFDVELVGVPTARERDGLAFSSRNKYLDSEERAQAVVLSRAVGRARSMVESGARDIAAIVASMMHELEQAPDARVQYVEVVDAELLEPIEQLTPGREILAAVAVFFGGTRLIDSAFVRTPRVEDAFSQTAA